MWCARQASPASSTSTVDQQEIIFDDNLQQSAPIGQHLNPNQSSQQSTICSINNINLAPNLHSNSLTITTTTSNATTGKRQANSGPRATKRPRTNKNFNSAKANETNGPTSKSTGNNKCSPPKRPKLYHLQQQLAPWKALQHHFLKHTDVKYRPEKRMTMAELGNEVLQRRNGWKVHHLVGQLTDLIQNEIPARERITSLLDIFVEEGAKRIVELANNCHKLPEQYETILKSQRSYGKNEFKPELIVTKMDDLLRGDLQRRILFDHQLRSCEELLVRVTNEHRDRVARLTTKFNKRIQL